MLPTALDDHGDWRLRGHAARLEPRHLARRSGQTDNNVAIAVMRLTLERGSKVPKVPGFRRHRNL